MPRPDDKRAKQGRPRDPRTTVFQEAFTPNMPSGQQNVFIKPGPEIIDQPSRTSYGNMVPGPSGGLEVLKGIVGGFNKGVTAYNQVHQDRVRRDKEKANKILSQEYVRVTNSDGTTDMVKKGGKQHNKYLAEYEEEQKLAKSDPNYKPVIAGITDGTDVSSFEHKRERLQGLLGEMTKEGRQYAKTQLNTAGKTHKRDLDRQAANQLRIDLANATTEVERETILDAAEENGYVEDGDEWTMIQIERAKIANRQADAAMDMAFDEFNKGWRLEFNKLDPVEARKLDGSFIRDKIIESKVFDDILNVPTTNENGDPLPSDEIEENRREALESAATLQARLEKVATQFELDRSNDRREHREYLEKATEQEWEDSWKNMDATRKLENITEWERRWKSKRTRNDQPTDESIIKREKTNILKDLLEEVAADDTGAGLLRVARDLGIEGPENYNGPDLAELVTRRMADKLGLTDQLENDNVYISAEVRNAEDAFIADLSGKEEYLRSFLTQRSNINNYERLSIQEEVKELDARKDAYTAADEEGKLKLLRDLGFLGNPTDLDGEIGRILDGESFRKVYAGLARERADQYVDVARKSLEDSIERSLNDPSVPLLEYTDWLGSSQYKPSYIDSRLTALDGDTDFLVEFMENPETRFELMTERLEDKGYSPEVVEELALVLAGQLNTEERKFEQHKGDAQSKIAARLKAEQQQAEYQDNRRSSVARLSTSGMDIFNLELRPGDSDHTGRAKLAAFSTVAGDAFTNLWMGLSRGAGPEATLPSALFDTTTPGGQILTTMISDDGLKPAIKALQEGDTEAIANWIVGLQEAGRFEEQDTQAVGEILQVLDFNSYLDNDGFSIRRFKTPIAQKLQAVMFGQLLALEGKGYNLSDPELFGDTPMGYQFNFGGDTRVDITQQVFQAFAQDADIRETGQMEFDVARFMAEMIQSNHSAQTLLAIGDSPDNALERQQTLSAIQSGTFLRSDDFIPAALKFGLTEEFARSIQLTGLILPNFDETMLASLDEGDRQFAMDGLAYLMSPDNGDVFSDDPKYRQAEQKLRGWFRSTMATLNETGADATYLQQLQYLYLYASGRALSADKALEGKVGGRTIEEAAFDTEEFIQAASPFVPAELAEEGDAEKMAEYIFRAINNNIHLEGLNPFTVMSVLNRKNTAEGPLVTKTPPLDALFFMALKPYELPDNMRFEPGLGAAVSGFAPRGYTHASSLGGTISYNTEDALFASAVGGDHTRDFVRGFVMQTQHHQEFGGLTLTQLEEAQSLADQLAAEITRRDDLGHPVDVLTVAVASEMILEQVSGASRQSELLQNLFAGIPEGLARPESFMDLEAIGSLIFVGSGYGDPTAEENMAFRFKGSGERIASIPDTEPFAEINPNQQFIQLGGQIRILTLGEMTGGDSPSEGGRLSYIYRNDHTLPTQLMEVSKIVRDTGRFTRGLPYLGKGRAGFSVPLENMSEEDQRTVLKRLTDNYENQVLMTMQDLGYIEIEKDTGVIRHSTTTVPASIFAGKGIDIGNVDPDDNIGIDVALEMIQQPLLLKRYYLEFLLAGKKGKDMDSFLNKYNPITDYFEGKPKDLAGLPRRVSVLGQVTGRPLELRTRTIPVDPEGNPMTREEMMSLSTQDFFEGGSKFEFAVLPFAYQPIQTVSRFDPVIVQNPDGSINEAASHMERAPEGYGIGGATQMAVDGQWHTTWGHVRNIFWPGQPGKTQIQKGRAMKAAEPTRYLYDSSKYPINLDNITEFRFKRFDDNGNPIYGPNSFPSIGAPYERMGIEDTAPAPYGYRKDGSPKGEGFLGLIEGPPDEQGNPTVMSEISIQFDDVANGQEIPTLVPTLNQEEINFIKKHGPDYLKQKDPIVKSIIKKAIDHANERISKGLPPMKPLDEKDLREQLEEQQQIVIPEGTA